MRKVANRIHIFKYFYENFLFMAYKVFTSDEFERDFSNLDTSLKIQIEKEIEQLEINPYVGKPLGYKFFREKKVKNYRIYYLISVGHIKSLPPEF